MINRVFANAKPGDFFYKMFLRVIYITALLSRINYSKDRADQISGGMKDVAKRRQPTKNS